MANNNPNKRTSVSQCKTIYAHLLKGGTITSLEAVNKFGCLRLSGRIWDIKRKHPEVEGRMITVNGKRVKEYYISQTEKL